MKKKDTNSFSSSDNVSIGNNSGRKDNKNTSSGVIHTMPDYYRNAELRKQTTVATAPSTSDKVVTPPTSNKQSKALIIILVFFILLAVMGVGGYFIYSNYQKNQAEETARLTALEEERQRQAALEAQRQAEEAQQQAQEDADAQLLESQAQQERDRQRIQDIHGMQVALEFYYDDQQSYPPFLPDQGTFSQDDKVYLDTIPQNPTPGGTEYLYSVNDGSEGYTLEFTLEVGMGDLKEGLNQVTEQRQLTTRGTIIARGPKSPSENDGTGYLISTDTDLDGVTDIEEAFYGTNPAEFDSDNDTYSDKQELINLYNPAGIAPIRLIESGIVQDYSSPVFDYMIYYPNTWNVKPLDATNTEVIFSSDTGEFIEVMVQDNAAGLSATEWFDKQNILPNVDLNQKAPTREGLVGIKSKDRRTVYFFEGDKVYIVIHNIGNKEEIDYDVTFEMMVRSFRLREPEVSDAAEESTPSNNNEGNTPEVSDENNL